MIARATPTSVNHYDSERFVGLRDSYDLNYVEAESISITKQLYGVHSLVVSDVFLSDVFLHATIVAQ